MYYKNDKSNKTKLTLFSWMLLEMYQILFE